MRKHLARAARAVAGILAQSYYMTQFARMVVKSYDNDCNADMHRNGESRLQGVVSSLSDVDSVFVDVGANVGEWSAALVR